MHDFPLTLTLSHKGRGDDPRSKQLERVRWRCRRGLLELDIVLGRFVEQHYAALDMEQQHAFEQLLDMPDTALWDMITNTELVLQERHQQNLLEQLRRA